MYRLGRGSGGRALSCKGSDPSVWQIEPAWWIHLQFGLYYVLTSGPQLVHQRMWYVLSCLWESSDKRSLAAYQEEWPIW